MLWKGRKSEIPNLPLIPTPKNICWFQISVQNSSFNQIFVALNNLLYYLKSFILIYRVFLSNELKKISVWAILTYDVVKLLCLVHIVKLHDVWVWKRLVNFNLVFKHRHVWCFELLQIYDFDSIELCIIFVMMSFVDFAGESLS